MAFTHALKQEKHKRGTQQFSSDSWGTCHLATPNSDDWSSFSCANCKILTNPLKIPRQNIRQTRMLCCWYVLLPYPIMALQTPHGESLHVRWQILCYYRVKGSRGQGMGVSQYFFLIETQKWSAGIWRKKMAFFLWIIHDAICIPFAPSPSQQDLTIPQCVGYCLAHINHQKPHSSSLDVQGPLGVGVDVHLHHSVVDCFTDVLLCSVSKKG